MSFLSKIESNTKINSEILKGYLETLLWSTFTDSEDSVYLDEKYKLKDIAPDAVKTAEQDIQTFIKKATDKGIDISKYKPSRIGHDFWLTRSGHGVGFSDSENIYGKNESKTLHTIAKSFKEIDVDVSNGKIYF